jgi:hypothetical protein
MAITDITPNYLSPLEFSFSINRLPYVKFYIQGANVPGVSGTPAEVSTPFRNIYFGGDNLTYNDFNITVRMDENINAYQEILNWIVGVNFPDQFDQFANLEVGDGIYSDASLIVLTTGKNPNILFKMKDIFPTSLGDLTMDTTAGDIEFVTCDITFKIGSYTIESI